MESTSIVRPAVGGFLFGYDLVIISGAQIFLRDYFNLNAAQYGFAVSSAVLGCMFGPALGAFMCDRFGRKATLIFAAVLFILGAIGTALPNSITTFYVFRIIGGVGVGVASLASPMYIAEVAPEKTRGRLGLMYQLAVVTGCTFATLVAWGLASTLPDDTSWRWMFASIIVPVIVFVILLIRVPQSPRWLAAKGQRDEAFSILARVTDEESAKFATAANLNYLRVRSV